MNLFDKSLFEIITPVRSYIYWYTAKLLCIYSDMNSARFNCFSHVWYYNVTFIHLSFLPLISVRPWSVHLSQSYCQAFALWSSITKKTKHYTWYVNQLRYAIISLLHCRRQQTKLSKCIMIKKLARIMLNLLELYASIFFQN